MDARSALRKIFCGLEAPRVSSRNGLRDMLANWDRWEREGRVAARRGLRRTDCPYTRYENDAQRSAAWSHWVWGNDLETGRLLMVRGAASSSYVPAVGYATTAHDSWKCPSYIATLTGRFVQERRYGSLFPDADHYRYQQTMAERLAWLRRKYAYF